MTALLELKQKIKRIYGKYEMYFLPVFKFALAFLYFTWINEKLGFMAQLNNVFVVLILSLICCILPSGVMVFTGFVLMIGHCYGLGIDVAAFMLVLILFMLILFLRFSAGNNIVLVFTPLSFTFNVPALLPIGAGLLGNAFSAFPAGCGVVIYYFIRFLRANAETFRNPDIEILDRLTMMADGLVTNWGMWLTVVVFIVVTLLVNLIRTRSFDYAWRIAIILGGVSYVVMVLAGSYYLGGTVNVTAQVGYTALCIVIGLILEFFVFGGDYTRTERLEYEDDEYYYYVKAVPKAYVTSSERSIKKISGSSRNDRKHEDAKSRQEKDASEKKARKEKKKTSGTAPVMQTEETDSIDFEKKLEESLKDL